MGWDQITLKSGQHKKWENLSPLREKLFIGNKNPILKSALLSQPYFLPIDWAPIGFLYKKTKFSSLKSLKSLPDIEGRISFPEPRTSSLGLQWYYWIYKVFEEDTQQIVDFLKKIKKESLWTFIFLVYVLRAFSKR